MTTEHADDADALDARGRERRSRIAARFCRQGDDERAFDREFWRLAGPQARFAAMWEMVIEAEALKGRDADQLRLQRSVASFRRRKG